MEGFFGIALFTLGILVGVILHKLFTRSAGTASKLSKNLDAVSQDFATYQDKVDTHFKETAELVQALTQNYAAVHQKLSTGAQELSRASIRPLEVTAKESYKAITNQEDDTALDPPRDYPEPK